jgi:hypothetical protein
MFAIAVLAMACGRTNPVRPEALPAAGDLPSHNEAFPVNGQLAAVRAATARYHNIATALAEGFTLINPATNENEPCVVDSAGVMGIHALNLARLGDQVNDPLQPEILLYVPNPAGGYRLVGVEYLRFVLVRKKGDTDAAPWIGHDKWGPEYEVVGATPTLFGQPFDGPMEGHTPTMPWHWDLHAWIWAKNPSGMFAPFNPSLSC